MMKKTSRLWLMVLVVILLAGCARPVENTPSAPVETSAPMPAVEAPNAEAPTPEPTEANRVVLVSASGAYPAMEAALGELAAEAGLTVETRESVQAGDLSAEWKVVVFPSAPGNLAELAAAAPQTQFVAASGAELPAGANVSVIRLRPEYTSFVAGYLGVVLAYDFRVGALLPAEGTAAETFVNGGRFFCGLCNSTYSPIVRFPVVSQAPAGTAAGQWQQAVDTLQQNYLYVMYVSPEAASSELLSYLTAMRYTLYGGQTPPDEFRSRWAATVREDLVTPLRALWPGVIAGQGGQTLEASVEIADVNADLLSTGRLEQVQKMIAEMAAGRIYPFNPPMD